MRCSRDAAELVGILAKMMKRGLGSGGSSSTPGFSSSIQTTPPRMTGGLEAPPAVPSPEMHNPI